MNSKDDNLEVPKDSRPFPPFSTQITGEPPGLEAHMDPPPRYNADLYKGSEKLKDKVALITGGDSGIGRSVAVLFAREGADVAITYTLTETEDAEKTVKLIENEGRKGIKILLDVRNYDDCKDAVKDVLDKFGQLDILVNNAAFQNHVQGIENLEIEQIKKTIDVNLIGYLFMIKASLKHLKKGAAIINTSSIVGTQGAATLIDYSATKGAVDTITKSLAQDLAKKSIRVNAVAPGPVWTPLNPAERSTKDIKDFGEDTLYHRPAQPEEIAPAYVYLASNITASYITGETIKIFGSTSASGG